MKILSSRPRRRCAAARLVLSILLAAAAIGGLATPGKAAGIITHAEVVERAIELVDEKAYSDLVDLLKDYREVVSYGSMFPDWAYTLFDGGLAELPHDTCPSLDCRSHRFRDILAAHLIPAFQNPQSEADRKSIAFLLGLIAHQEADNPWHFPQSGSPLALEPALSLENPKFGTAAEFIAELLIAQNMLEFENRPEFWYPADELLAVYQEVCMEDPAGFCKDGVSMEDLKKGTDRQPFVYYAEVFVVYFILPPFLRIADLPLMYYLENYPFGGLHDGAKHTAEAWQQTWDWLRTYPPETSISLSPPQAGGSRGWGRQPEEISLIASGNLNAMGEFSGSQRSRPFSRRLDFHFSLTEGKRP